MVLDTWMCECLPASGASCCCCFGIRTCFIDLGRRRWSRIGELRVHGLVYGVLGLELVVTEGGAGLREILGGAAAAAACPASCVAEAIRGLIRD